jgi:putative ABC transport system substrate-binding protein
MKRREFICAIGGVVAWSGMTHAQQPAVKVIGFLGPTTPQLFAARLQSFRQGVAEAGFDQDSSVRVDDRWAAGDMKKFPALAAEVASRAPSVIAAAGLSAALAAKAATSTIPVVFFIGEDPVGVGLVTSLNRPGANLTGVTTLNTEIGPKRLEMIRQVVPSASTIAVLINPASPNTDALAKSMLEAARNLGVELQIVRAAREADFEPLFASLAERRVGALVITTDAFYISRAEQLARLSERHAVPAIFQYREFAAAGGLMSYGGSFLDGYRQVGVYAGRILKGEKPGELPVQQATKIELFLNLKTAKSLGLSIPLSLLGRADEVIE